MSLEQESSQSSPGHDLKLENANLSGNEEIVIDGMFVIHRSLDEMIKRSLFLDIIHKKKVFLCIGGPILSGKSTLRQAIKDDYQDFAIPVFDTTYEINELKAGDKYRIPVSRTKAVPKKVRNKANEFLAEEVEMLMDRASDLDGGALVLVEAPNFGVPGEAKSQVDWGISALTRILQNQRQDFEYYLPYLFGDRNMFNFASKERDVEVSKKQAETDQAIFEDKSYGGADGRMARRHARSFARNVRDLMLGDPEREIFLTREVLYAAENNRFTENSYVVQMNHILKTIEDLKVKVPIHITGHITRHGERGGIVPPPLNE